MSIQAVAWVLDESEATGPARLVLFALANHADKDTMTCWPSVPTIAHEARLHRTTVMRAIRELEGSGQIEVQRSGAGRGRVNHYRIVTGSTVAPSDLSSGSPDDPEKVALRAEKVALPREKVALERPEPLEPLEPKDSLSASPPARNGWSAVAHDLTCRWWEARLAEDNIAPGQPFPAAAKVVDGLLKKGWHPDLVARGLTEVPAVSGAAFDLWRRRQATGNGAVEREARSIDVVRERVARRGR